MNLHQFTFHYEIQSSNEFSQVKKDLIQDFFLNTWANIPVKYAKTKIQSRMKSIEIIPPPVNETAFALVKKAPGKKSIKKDILVIFNRDNLFLLKPEDIRYRLAHEMSHIFFEHTENPYGFEGNEFNALKNINELEAESNARFVWNFEPSNLSNSDEKICDYLGELLKLHTYINKSLILQNRFAKTLLFILKNERNIAPKTLEAITTAQQVLLKTVQIGPLD